MLLFYFAFAVLLDMSDMLHNKHSISIHFELFCLLHSFMLVCGNALKVETPITPTSKLQAKERVKLTAQLLGWYNNCRDGTTVSFHITHISAV